MIPLRAAPIRTRCPATPATARYWPRRWTGGCSLREKRRRRIFSPRRTGRGTVERGRLARLLERRPTLAFEDRVSMKFKKMSIRGKGLIFRQVDHPILVQKAKGILWNMISGNEHVIVIANRDKPSIIHQ